MPDWFEPFRTTRVPEHTGHGGRGVASCIPPTYGITQPGPLPALDLARWYPEIASKGE